METNLIEILTKALEEIKEFGYQNPGCGYSCARKAAEILNKIKDLSKENR